MGDYCYVGKDSYIWSAKKISIGNRVLISHNCNIFDKDTHPLDKVERHNQFKDIIFNGHSKNINLNEEEVLIENDVLIGACSIILKGVRIGEGAVFSAGSMVTGDVPPDTVVAGNPARVIRKLNKEYEA
jgi:acetyltransferase-like isoleucine patch superfamily enzyme